MFSRIDRNRMIGYISHEDDNGNDLEIAFPLRFEVCGRCDGRGVHVHEACSVWTESDRDDDPDGFSAMMQGAYDVTCEGCRGERVQPDCAIEYEQMSAEQQAAMDLQIGANVGAGMTRAPCGWNVANGDRLRMRIMSGRFSWQARPMARAPKTNSARYRELAARGLTEEAIAEKCGTLPHVVRKALKHGDQRGRPRERGVPVRIRVAPAVYAAAMARAGGERDVGEVLNEALCEAFGVEKR